MQDIWSEICRQEQKIKHLEERRDIQKSKGKKTWKPSYQTSPKKYPPELKSHPWKCMNPGPHMAHDWFMEDTGWSVKSCISKQQQEDNRQWANQITTNLEKRICIESKGKQRYQPTLWTIG
jgi:hypothetical protein